MRAGELAAPGLATAWITIDVPPLLKTELGSSPRVTFGATTLTWALPSAAMINVKSGISPAGAELWS